MEAQFSNPASTGAGPVGSLLVQLGVVFMSQIKHASEFKSAEELLEATAMNLDKAACGFAQSIYGDKQFQVLARLDKTSQDEQDRILNELILACIVLIMLVFESPDLSVRDDVRAYYRDLLEIMPDAHIKYLESLDIESKHLKLWKKLIRMRYDEYRSDKHDVRAAAMKLQTQEKDMDTDDLSSIQLLLPVQTVAIGCHHHICRQKTEGRDELFKLILEHLSKFYVELRVMLEGDKTTPLMRARIVSRRLFRRLRGLVQGEL